MARVFTEGFESGDILFITANISASASTTQARSGTYSVTISSSTSNHASRDITAISEGYVRFGYWNSAVQTTGNILRWFSGATEMGSIRMNGTSRAIDIYTGASTLAASGTTVLQSSTWYLIEVRIKIADAGGIITVKVDGTQDANFSGDTKPSTETTFNLLRWSCTGATHYFDDLALNDTTGGSDNSWCGDGKIIALMPNANGDLSQLTNSAGNSTNNYTYVDERPSNSDTDYVEGSTIDNKDLYNMAASGLGSVSIKRVWAESRSRDTVANGGLVALVIKTNSTEYASADKSLLTSYTQIKGTEYLVNPNTSAAWSVADLDAIQAGPKTRS